MDRLTARQLFDAVGERLSLRWVAGMRGENRAIETGGHQSRRPSLVGYLNIIYPNKVQIIGTEELDYLDSLDSRQRWETVEKIVALRSRPRCWSPRTRPSPPICARPPRNRTRRCGTAPSAATSC